jgi:hypothetical protein
MNPDSKIPRPALSYRMMEAVVGPFFKWLGLSCRDAFTLSCDQMDRKLTRGESFRLRTHLVMCGICRHLPKQFQGLRTLIRASSCEHHDPDSPDLFLSPEAKQRIRESLESQKK